MVARGPAWGEREGGHFVSTFATPAAADPWYVDLPRSSWLCEFLALGAGSRWLAPTGSSYYSLYMHTSFSLSSTSRMSPTLQYIYNYLICSETNIAIAVFSVCRLFHGCVYAINSLILPHIYRALPWVDAGSVTGCFPLFSGSLVLVLWLRYSILI